MTTHIEIASKLLRDAAGFFREIAAKDKNLQEQMNSNADVYEQTAALLESNPQGTLAFDQEAINNSTPGNWKHPDLKQYLIYEAKWENVEPLEASPIQELLESFLSEPPRGNSAEVHKTPLTFYPDTFLLEVNDTRKMPERRPEHFLVVGERKLIKLGGSSGAFYDANEIAPITLNKNNVIDYLRLFTFFVHAKNGPFPLVESLDHPVFDQSRMEQSTQDTINKEIRKAKVDSIIQEEERTVYQISTTLVYNDTLFRANFSVDSNGATEMIDDEPIIDKIPVRKLHSSY